MSKKTIVILTWDSSGTAYEAFSKFRDLDDDSVRVNASAVVEREFDGTIRVTDGQDNKIGLSSIGGSGIGALIGILGGPLGMLLGFAGGAAVGSAWDIGRAVDTDDVLSVFSGALPPGYAGIIAELEEQTPDAVNRFASETGAVLIRRNEDEVLDEVAAAESAADAAADAARKVTQEAQKERNHEQRQARIERIKTKLRSN